MKKLSDKIIVEQTFDAPLNVVWDAITRIDEMREWFFENIPAFEATVDFVTQFDVQSETRIFRHLWRITNVVPFEKISYNWKYEGYPGDSMVHFELFVQDGKTALRLTHEILENFPTNIPEFSTESGRAGWTFFIKSRLKDYIEKNQKASRHTSDGD